MHTARPSNLYFWRDNHGHEVDLVLERGDGLLDVVEVKSAYSIRRGVLRGIDYWRALAAGVGARAGVVYAGEVSGRRGDVEIIGWRDVGGFFEPGDLQ